MLFALGPHSWSASWSAKFRFTSRGREVRRCLEICTGREVGCYTEKAPNA